MSDDLGMDINKCITWQYNNAEKLKSIIALKAKWYSEHYTNFWKEWYEKVFNIDTANSFGLTLWGKLLNIERPTYIDANGNKKVFDDEMFRLLLKGQIMLFNTNGSAFEVNRYLEFIFRSKGEIYAIDRYNMLFDLFVDYYPDEKEKAVLENIYFLPRPAGVWLRIVNHVKDETFGFAGSEFQPFEQGIFGMRV